jgi:hypothetical protein
MLKKYNKMIIIFIVSFLLNNSCSNIILNNYVKEVKKINNRVTLNDWSIYQKYTISDGTSFFYLKKNKNDTIYRLQFSYYKKNKEVNFLDYYISYCVNDDYYELSLVNDDTLYFYTCKNSDYDEGRGPFRNFDRMNFITGKYYFMCKFGKLYAEQRNYFENHKDSLTKIRGNDLPDLPELKIIIDTTYIDEHDYNEIIVPDNFFKRLIFRIFKNRKN